MSGSPRQCRHCRGDVAVDQLACPACGRYFDGGFDLPDLIDGIRTLQPVLDEVPAGTSSAPPPVTVRTAQEVAFPEPTGEGWWSDAGRPPHAPAAAQRAPHEGHLPPIGAIADLPYAEPAVDGAPAHGQHDRPGRVDRPGGVDQPVDAPVDRDAEVIDLREPPRPRPLPRSGRSWLRSRSRT